MTQMTTLTQSLFEQISQLPEAQQAALATYLQKHLDQIIAQAEKEHRIATGSYTINDFNEETQAAICDVANRKDLIACKDADDLYKQLGI
jgi:hypothetical protein